MQILGLWGISFHAVVVFGLGKNLLVKSILGRCGREQDVKRICPNFRTISCLSAFDTNQVTNYMYLYYLLVFALKTNSWFVMLGSIQFGLGSPKHCKGKPCLNEIAIFPSKYLKTNSLLLQQGLVIVWIFQP